MRAEILSYSRTRGLFAGLSLEGSVVKQDKDGNENVYGEPVDAKRLLLEGALRGAGRGPRPRRPARDVLAAAGAPELAERARPPTGGRGPSAPRSTAAGRR